MLSTTTIRMITSQRPAPDTKKVDNYVYLNTAANKLGKGNFGEVYRGVHFLTGREVAVKVIATRGVSNRVTERLIVNQVNIVGEIKRDRENCQDCVGGKVGRQGLGWNKNRGKGQCKHYNILKCEDILSSNNNCYLVTQFYPNGNLQQLITKKKSIKQQQQIFPKILHGLYKGLLYLSSRHIIHRDLKPANILLTSQFDPIIADFGFAVKSDKPFKDINIGSKIYMSPESMLLHQYSGKCDVWAFGVLVYEMLWGDAPMADCREERELKERVVKPVGISGVSGELGKMLKLCLTVDPNCRPDIEELGKCQYIMKLRKRFQKQNQIQQNKERVSKKKSISSRKNQLSNKLTNMIIQQEDSINYQQKPKKHPIPHNLSPQPHPRTRNRALTLPQPPNHPQHPPQSMQAQCPQKQPQDLYSTYDTIKSMSFFLKQVKSYDQIKALLHYCRLVHKTAQEVPSTVLSQWLLNIFQYLGGLRKIQGGDREKNENMVGLLRDYAVKYRKEHVNYNEEILPKQVILQCQKLQNQLINSPPTPTFTHQPPNYPQSLFQPKTHPNSTATLNPRLHTPAINLTHNHNHNHNNDLKNKLEIVQKLKIQTQVLQKFMFGNKMASYAKISKIDSYLEGLAQYRGGNGQGGSGNGNVQGGQMQMQMQMQMQPTFKDKYYKK